MLSMVPQGTLSGMGFYFKKPFHIINYVICIDYVAMCQMFMCRDLVNLTNIDLKTMKNILGSMLFAKDLQVLKKTPSSKSIDEGHEIELNGAYKNPSRVSVCRVLRLRFAFCILHFFSKTLRVFLYTKTENHLASSGCGG